MNKNSVLLTAMRASQSLSFKGLVDSIHNNLLLAQQVDFMNISKELNGLLQSEHTKKVQLAKLNKQKTKEIEQL